MPWDDAKAKASSRYKGNTAEGKDGGGFRQLKVSRRAGAQGWNLGVVIDEAGEERGVRFACCAEGF